MKTIATVTVLDAAGKPLGRARMWEDGVARFEKGSVRCPFRFRIDRDDGAPVELRETTFDFNGLTFNFTEDAST